MITVVVVIRMVSKIKCFVSGFILKENGELIILFLFLIRSWKDLVISGINVICCSGNWVRLFNIFIVLDWFIIFTVNRNKGIFLLAELMILSKVFFSCIFKVVIE